MSEHLIHVGPNATLSRSGLRINNEHAELRHIDDFRAFAQATSARIETVLVELFPEPTSLTGKPDAPKGEAWKEYAAAVMQLQVDDLAGALKAGKTLLRWCLAAYCVAHIQKHAVRETDDFIPV